MRTRVAGFLLFLCLAPGLPACRKAAPQVMAQDTDAGLTRERMVRFDAAALERLGVRSDLVGSSSGTIAVEFPGTLEYAPNHYVEVGTLFEGRVTAVNVRVGDSVRKGQVLAVIAAPSLVNAQAEAISARAEAEVARAHFKRESALLAQMLTTAREAEVAREGLVRAEANFAGASAKLALVGLAPGQGTGRYGMADLTSPIAGVVVKRDAVVGAHINYDDTPFVVADGSTLIAAFDVFEGDLELVKENANVLLRVDALPGKIFHGAVSALDPQLGTETRAVRARVRVANEQAVLRPGLFVRVTVESVIPVVADRLRVPVGAVQPMGGDEVVFVEQKPGVYEVRPVLVGHRYGQIVELMSGLVRGERIVTHGAFILRSELSRQ